MEAVAKALGFQSATSGSATVAVAAMKKFGLLEEHKQAGERILRLSALAFDVLLNPHPQAALKHAALLPPIHKEMWEEYGRHLPSVETLRWKLVKRGFTESGVQDFLKVYRDTLTFAGLDTPEEAEGADAAEGTDDDGVLTISQQIPDGHQTESASFNSAAPTAQAHGMRLPLRLAGGEIIYIEGEFPVSRAAFENFLQILDVMRPGLVREAPSAEA